MARTNTRLRRNDDRVNVSGQMSLSLSLSPLPSSPSRLSLSLPVKAMCRQLHCGQIKPRQYQAAVGRVGGCMAAWGGIEPRTAHVHPCMRMHAGVLMRTHAGVHAHGRPLLF